MREKFIYRPLGLPRGDRGLGVDGLGFSSYQLVSAGISCLILFTHTIYAFGHSANTVPVRRYASGNSQYRIQAPLPYPSNSRVGDPPAVYGFCTTSRESTSFGGLERGTREKRESRPVVYPSSTRRVVMRWGADFLDPRASTATTRARARARKGTVPFADRARARVEAS